MILRWGTRKMQPAGPVISAKIRGVVTNSTSASDSGSGAETLKFKMYSDPDDRRGYKFDGNLDLTALIDRSSTMGFINASDADGFKARNFRTGGEPPDPEKAKEIMVFFKNRPKPPNKIDSADLKNILQGAKDSISGHAKEATTSFFKNRPLGVGSENDSHRTSSARQLTKVMEKTSHHGAQIPSASSRQKIPQPNSPNFNKSVWRKTHGEPNQVTSQAPRGNYKLNKPPKKTMNQS